MCKANHHTTLLCLKASRHAGGGNLPHENAAGEPESASKRRRRSEDKDVAEAAVDADGAPADGPKPVNGHPVTATNGDVPPEAAFWTALEDAKDEVRALCCSVQTHIDTSKHHCGHSLEHKCKDVQGLYPLQKIHAYSFCPFGVPIQDSLACYCKHHFLSSRVLVSGQLMYRDGTASKTIIHIVAQPMPKSVCWSGTQ